MTKKVLIDEQKGLASQLIYDTRRDALLMSKLVASYNNLPIVAPIETASQAKDFLTNPVKFLDEAILRDCGVSFGNARPRPSTIAKMFDIGYEYFVELVKTSGIKSRKLELFLFDENTKRVEMAPEGEEQIKEECRLYIYDGEEKKEWDKIQALADGINGLCPRYNLDGTDINRVPSALRFFISTPKQGGGWELKPNASAIKKAIGKPANK